MATFEALPLQPTLQASLAALGLRAPTAVQADAIPALLAGRDLIAVAPTGTGKTAAYLLPMLQRLQPGALCGLVLAPTRELAAQIEEAAGLLGRDLPIRRTALFGGVPDGPQIAALRDGVELVVATPGRLLDLLDRGHVDLRAVEVFVIDEADRLLDDGFHPDCHRLRAALPSTLQTVLVSATMSAQVEALASAFLREPERVVIEAPEAALGAISQHVLYVRKADKHLLLAHVVVGMARVLVFTRTRAGADRAVELLGSRGVRSVSLHGDLSQAVRRRALEAFRAGEVDVLVATDVASRGLHIEGVSHVVNFDLPSEPETYVHRVGRTGRAGARGVSYSFCDPTEQGYLRGVEALCGRALQPLLAHPFHDHDLIPGRLPPKGGGARGGRRRRGGRA